MFISTLLSQAAGSCRDIGGWEQQWAAGRCGHSLYPQISRSVDYSVGCDKACGIKRQDGQQVKAILIRTQSDSGEFTGLSSSSQQMRLKRLCGRSLTQAFRLDDYVLEMIIKLESLVHLDSQKNLDRRIQIGSVQERAVYMLYKVHLSMYILGCGYFDWEFFDRRQKSTASNDKRHHFTAS